MMACKEIVLDGCFRMMLFDAMGEQMRSCLSYNSRKIKLYLFEVSHWSVGNISLRISAGIGTERINFVRLFNGQYYRNVGVGRKGSRCRWISMKLIPLRDSQHRRNDPMEQ